MQVEVSQRNFEKALGKLEVMPTAQDILTQLQVARPNGAAIHHVNVAKGYLSILIGSFGEGTLDAETFRDLRERKIVDECILMDKLYRTFVAGCYQVDLDL